MIRQLKNMWVLTRSIGMLLVVIVLGALSAMTTAGSQLLPLPGSDFNLFSEAQEIEIGNKWAKEIEKEQPLINDAAIQAYLDALGLKLAKNSPRPNLKYEFRLLNTDDINAASIPGHVYVNKGLIATADSELELAGVLGHELGHIAGKHSVEQLSKKYVVGGILGTAGSVVGLADRDLEDLFKSVGGAGAFLIAQNYSRNQEREADSIGLRTVVRAGMDPSGIVRFLRKLASKQNSKDKELILFQSHPLPSERIENVQAEIGSMNLENVNAGDNKAFLAFKGRVVSIRTPNPKK